MSSGFWVRSSNLVSVVCVTLDVQLEFIRSSVEVYLVIFLAQQKAHAVQSHFKLGRNPNETGTHTLFNPVPRELQRQDVVIRIGCSLGTAPRLDVSFIIEVTLLLHRRR